MSRDDLAHGRYGVLLLVNEMSWVLQREMSVPGFDRATRVAAEAPGVSASGRAGMLATRAASAVRSGRWLLASGVAFHPVVARKGALNVPGDRADGRDVPAHDGGESTRFMVMATLAAMVVLTMTTAVFAIEEELAAYDAAALQVCERHPGATPDMQAKYDVLVAALHQAQYGYGRSASASNFWGPVSPQQLVERCFQSPGDGAAGD